MANSGAALSIHREEYDAFIARLDSLIGTELPALSTQIDTSVESLQECVLTYDTNETVIGYINNIKDVYDKVLIPTLSELVNLMKLQLQAGDGIHAEIKSILG
mgnify:CR=1 FL=1